jgi:hypothetical protein
MFAKLPTFALAGVPCKRPVLVENVAHDGRFTMLNVSVPPFASAAVGVKVYCVPTVPVVAGVPEIVGGTFAAVTAIANAGNAAVAMPSLTPIRMLLYVPTWVAPGVPWRAPVVALNVAHAGRFAIVNVSALPSASAADG